MTLLSFYCSRAVNREYEVNIIRSTACFKRKILIFCNIWRKRRLAFAVHYTLNRACKTEQMEFAWVHQSHLLRAHQIWFTHRGILAMPVIHIHLLLTEAHNQTEGKTNTEHGLVNTRVTCGLPLPFEWLWNQLLFSLLPLFPSSSNPLCLLHHAIPAFSEITLDTFLLFLPD